MLTLPFTLLSNSYLFTTPDFEMRKIKIYYSVKIETRKKGIILTRNICSFFVIYRSTLFNLNIISR